MHIGGGAALEAARRRAGRAMRKPAFGVAIITPLILAGAVGASAPSTVAPIRDSAVTPLAAVESSPGKSLGCVGGSGHQDADPVSHRRRDDLRSPAIGGSEFAWDTSHSSDSAVGLPKRGTDDGGGRPWLRRELESSGRHRAHRIDARQRWRHRRARHRGAADLRARAGRHVAGQRGHRAEPQRRPSDVCPRDGSDAVPARHVVPIRQRRRWRRQGRCAERVRLFAGERPVTSAAAG